jgi:hypothetical protein
MRHVRIVLVLTAGLLLAGRAASQPPGGPGGFGGGGLAGMIGQSKQLQDELRMDKDQVDKLTGALAKVREALRDDMAKLRAPDISQEQRADVLKKVGEANAKALESVLKPEQVKRLRQIEIQQAGLAMYAKEDVQKALKLTDDQKEKIDEINKSLQKDLRELSPGGPGGGGPGGRGGRGGFDPEVMKKREGLQKEAKELIVKVLNDDQKATLNDLTGAPFELRLDAFGGPGGGRGGQGGPGGGGRGGLGGPGGPGGFGVASPPGQVMSSSAQDALRLNADQKRRMEELQKEVDSQLDKILTDEQKRQLKEMQQGAGRGGPGGGRGRGGPGGEGGRPPDKPQ